MITFLLVIFLSWFFTYGLCLVLDEKLHGKKEFKKLEDLLK